jgi:hypothetical protein
MLVELKFKRLALEIAIRHNNAADTIGQQDQAATDQLIKWKAQLEKDENWIS